MIRHHHGTETKVTLAVILLLVATVTAIVESHREEIEASGARSSH